MNFINPAYMSTNTNGPCGPYDREHDFGPFIDEEERGVLVITHGKRAGRIYATERAWRERVCKKCSRREHEVTVNNAGEWPGGV